MKKPCDFIILIDALRYDYVTPDATPFLFELKSRSQRAQVVETYSFQTRPAYFAGLEPEQSNICHLYEYNPQESPFSFIRSLGCIPDLLDASGLDRFFRGVVRRIAKRRALSMGHRAAASVMGTEKIPFRLLPYFALSERCFTDDPGAFGEAKTVFDHFREHNKTWAWIGYPRHYGSTDSIVSAFREHQDTDIAYLHFSELDWIGHRFGPGSKEIQTGLRRIDGVIQSLIEPALQHGHCAVIFGDHGMVEVEYELDLQTRLRKLPLRLPGDYLYFLDSTQARFWFFTDRAEQLVRELLKDLDGGHVLGPVEREELRINFGDNRYGDLIFAVDGPGIIHPSFFGTGDSGPRGMHGYLPQIRDNMTQVIVAGEGIAAEDIGTIPMVQIFDLMRSALLR